MAYTKGFTLIEVLVALTIFTVATVAASRASMGYIKSTEHMRNKTLAHFVAKNRMADMHIHNEWAQGQSKKQVTENGGTWQIIQTSKPSQYDNLRRIELSIAPVLENAGNDTQANPVTDFTFLLAKPVSSDKNALNASPF